MHGIPFQWILKHLIRNSFSILLIRTKCTKFNGFGTTNDEDLQWPFCHLLSGLSLVRRKLVVLPVWMSFGCAFRTERRLNIFFASNNTFGFHKVSNSQTACKWAICMQSSNRNQKKWTQRNEIISIFKQSNNWPWLSHQQQQQHIPFFFLFIFLYFLFCFLAKTNERTNEKSKWKKKFEIILNKLTGLFCICMQISCL